jgi:hypothetical protein
VCGYKVLGKNRTVNLWVQQGTAGKAGFDNAKATFKADAENVSGIAKKAFYVSGGLNTLYLLKRDTLVYVQYVALDVEDDAAIKQAVTDLAKIVVKRV